MALEFKAHIKKSPRIDIRLKTGNFYPCTKEQVHQMAMAGNLSESNIRSLFTPESIEKHLKAKEEDEKANARSARKAAKNNNQTEEQTEKDK